MHSNLTFVSNLHHIQSMKSSKSGRTKLRLIVLVGLKQRGATKLRLPINTGFNFCVAIARNGCKSAPTNSHSGNTKNAYLLEGDAVSLRDSVQKIRRHELPAVTHRTKQVTKLKTQVIRIQFAFTLYFTGHTFVTSVLTYFKWNQFSLDNLLELRSDAIRKLLFFP
jgi:hypothetical protein